jgi:hypothetical protein
VAFLLYAADEVLNISAPHQKEALAVYARLRKKA